MHQLTQQSSTNDDVLIILQPNTMNSPCFLDIFQAGPSRERSTSMGLSFVALPNVICRARRTHGGNVFAMTSNSTIQCWKKTDLPLAISWGIEPSVLLRLRESGCQSRACSFLVNPTHRREFHQNRSSPGGMARLNVYLRVYVPVMLSTRTCQRGSSCSSCLISLFWWRSEIISSERATRWCTRGEGAYSDMTIITGFLQHGDERSLLPCSNTSSLPSLCGKTWTRKWFEFLKWVNFFFFFFF